MINSDYSIRKQKAMASELASIIFWTGFNKEEDDNHRKMESLKSYMSEENFIKINNKTIHSKYQTRLCFNTKEDASHVYKKYKHNKNMPRKWGWSIFNLSEYKLE